MDSADPGAGYDGTLSAYLARVNEATSEALAETSDLTNVDDAKAALFLDAEFGLRPALDAVFRTKSFRKLGAWAAEGLKEDAMDADGIIGSRLRAAGEWGSAKGMEVLRRFGYEPGGEPGPWMNLLRKSGIIPNDFNLEDLVAMKTPEGRERVMARVRGQVTERARAGLYGDPRIQRWRAQLDEKRQQAEGLRDRALAEVDARRQQVEGLRDRGLAEVDARRQQVEGLRDRGMAEFDARRQQVEGLRDRGMAEFDARRQQVEGLRDRGIAEFDSRRQQVEGLRDRGVAEFDSRRQQVEGLRDRGVAEFDSRRQQVEGLRDRGLAEFDARRAQATQQVEGLRDRGVAEFDARRAQVEGLRDRGVAEVGARRAQAAEDWSGVTSHLDAGEGWPGEAARLGRQSFAARTIGNLGEQGAAARDALASTATTAAEEADEFAPLQTPRSLSRTVVRQPSILEEEGGMTGNFFTRAYARLKSAFSSHAEEAGKAFSSLQVLETTADATQTRMAAAESAAGARDTPWLARTMLEQPSAPATAVRAGTEVLTLAGEPIAQRAALLRVRASEGLGNLTESLGRGAVHLGAQMGLSMGFDLAADQIHDESTRRGVEISGNSAQTLDQILPSRFGGGNIEAATDKAMDMARSGWQMVRGPLVRPPPAMPATAEPVAAEPVAAEPATGAVQDAAVQQPAVDTAAAATADADIAAQGATTSSAGANAAEGVADGLEGAAEDAEVADEIPGVGEILGALFGIGMLIGSIAETTKPADRPPDFTGIPLPGWQPGV